MGVLLEKVRSLGVHGGSTYNTRMPRQRPMHTKILQNNAVEVVKDSPCRCTGSAYKRCLTRPLNL